MISLFSPTKLCTPCVSRIVFFFSFFKSRFILDVLFLSGLRPMPVMTLLVKENECTCQKSLNHFQTGVSEFKCDCNNFLLRLLRLVLLSRFILLISLKGELARRLVLKLPEAESHLLFLLLLLLFSLPPNMVTMTSRENPFL